MKAKKYMIIGIFILMIALVGSVGTYAWFTWKSTSNTSLTMTIGKLADVIFTSGNDISTSTLAPVFNYTDGELTTFSINNRDTSGTIINYGVKLNITSIATELKSTSLKYVLLKNNTIVQEGDFSTISTGSTTIYSDSISSSGTTDFKFYLYIDGNEENDILMMNKKMIGKLEAGTVPFSQFITNLYNNAEKTTATNNNITYNYAPTVGLMNDRLGSMATEINNGNIRYSGLLENQAISAWQSTSTSELAIKYGGSKFTSENDCLAKTQALATCSISYSNLGFSSVEECEANIDNVLYQMTGETTLEAAQDKFCRSQVQESDAKNYVYFNCSDYSNQSSSTCELWRIIGVFDGKVKLIKNETIGKYSWDNKDTTTGAEEDKGKNDWSDARLMKLLNPGYESEGIGGSLYYNSGIGNCYSGQNNAVESCNFTSSGIKNYKTKNMIADTSYNLGGSDTPTLYPNQIYEKERGTTVYTGRPTTWTGKIALAYPSDYGYAADLSLCSSTLDNYKEEICSKNNWMTNIITHYGYKSGFLLTPNSSKTYTVWDIMRKDTMMTTREKGAASTSALVYAKYAVVPVLYLKDDVNIIVGNGNINNPYQLSLN